MTESQINLIIGVRGGGGSIEERKSGCSFKRMTPFILGFLSRAKLGKEAG